MNQINQYMNPKYIKLIVLMNKIIYVNFNRQIKIRIILRNINKNKLKAKMSINKYQRFKIETVFYTYFIKS